MPIRRWIAVGFSYALLVFLAGSIHAAPYSGLFIFGDSLSDPGNNAI